ncbi:Peroxisomal membrane signal receptor PTS1 [Orobanche minor]
MAMRELVSGGAACAVPGSTSPSNPLGALANALIRSSSKTERKALRNTNCNHYDIRWQFICRGGRTLRRCHSRVGA